MGSHELAEEAKHIFGKEVNITTKEAAVGVGGRYRIQRLQRQVYCRDKFQGLKQHIIAVAEIA